MKQILLFASAIALMTSCAKTELGQQESAPVEGKGITFSTSIAENAETKADFVPNGKLFNTKWYADKDKIGIFYKGDVEPFAGQDKLPVNGSTDWFGLKVNTTESNSFVFKATASSTNGVFVAQNDENTLWLATPSTPKAKTPTFRAYWPIEDAQARTDFATSSEVDLPLLTAQTQKTIYGNGIVENAFMVSESEVTSDYDANDNSVSKDKFTLAFERISPIVYFKILSSGANTATANREYIRDYARGIFTRFGALKSVTLESMGSTKAGSSLTKTPLTFNSDAKWDMLKVKLEEGFVSGTVGAATSITTTMSTNGLDWSNDAVAYMAVANVDRAKYLDQKESEKMVATYKFNKITLTQTVETNKSWVGNMWVGFPTQSGYDLDSDPYIAYEFAPNVFALEINPSFNGNLEGLFETNGNLKGIKDGSGNAINKSAIQHFVSKVKITSAADFKTIRSLGVTGGVSALSNITLLENTELPALAFEDLNALTYINLPKVTAVADVNAFKGTAAYTEVYMGSYDFSDKTGTNQTAVRDRLLKSANLVKADVSAVASINAGFPKSGVTFQGFSALKEITVKDGVIIGGAGFQTCGVLTLVQFPVGVTNGAVELLAGANSQFDGCTQLPKIALKTTEIPDIAFRNCPVLSTINGANGKAIVPTAIGISAFENTTPNAALVDMDLSVATSIGAAAFKNCTALVGNNKLNSQRTVLYVDAVTHVSDNVFEGCTALQYISFASATTVGVEFLKGVNCEEIEFMKAFTVDSKVATTAATNFFGNVAKASGITYNTKLFCNKAQSGVITNTITLNGNASSSVASATTFGGTIEKKY